MIKKAFNAVKEVLGTTFKGMGTHGLMTYAASIGFYTIFSLPGLLITIIITAGVFLGQEAATGELSAQLNDVIGESSASSIEDIILGIELAGDNTLQTIIGVGTLVFSATTIFMSLQDALNRIWDVVATPKKGFIKYILNRVLSLGMIIGLGFILLVSLMLDTALEFFFNQIQGWIGKEPSMLLEIASSVVSFGVVFLVIMLIFKYLPDVKLKWSNVRMAALITSGLFILGKIGIGYYIENSSFSQTYSAADSIIALLVWVYYSTVVVLFGAEITRAIMIYQGHPIQPAKAAKKIAIQQLDYEEYLTRFDNQPEAEDANEEKTPPQS